MSKLSWAVLMAGITAAVSPAWGQEKSSQPSDATEDSDSVVPAEKHVRPYSQFDRYMLQGPATRLPPVSESILQDKDDFRTDLAKHGIGIQMMSLSNMYYDMSSPKQSHPQVYAGQKFTATSLNQVLVTYDMGGEGLDQRQLVFGALNNDVTWDALGPRRSVSMSRFSYYQSFLNRKIEVSAGYMSNDLEFVGIITGGSLSGGTLGINSVIPFAVGGSHLPTSTPTLNVTYHFDGGLYNKIGFQRSVSPSGAEEEDHENPYALKFATEGSKLLTIEEFGFRREATASNPYTWLRAGVMNNQSKFERYDEPGKESTNYALYLLGDRQISNSGPLPFNGWYIGGTMNYAPEDRNAYSQFYEARLYKMGPMASRPLDMLSMNVSRNEFSKDLYRLSGGTTEKNSTSATVSYLARVSPGVFLNFGLSYTNHPALTEQLDPSVSALFGVNLFF